MLLGKRFEAFIEQSPVSVMVRGTLERIFDPAELDRVFEDQAVLQYTKELTFSQCVRIMSDVVFRVSPSVGAWYTGHPEGVPVTRQAVYEKLKHLELPISAAVVGYSADQLLPCLSGMTSPAPALLSGYRVRVLDGNHLAGTDHRILELRRYRAAPLPGQSLVIYDPQYDLATDVIPCEDAYAQERSLLGEALERLRARDCLVADRNFCTTGFLFGIARRDAFFVIRQHASTLTYQLLGKPKHAGTDDRGRAMSEQAVRLSDPETGATLQVRRITIALLKPTSQGETEIHILTNLPAADADAVKVADLYADRWTIETAFQHLTVDLQCELNTLGYPKAALFGFCLALVAYNVVGFVKGVVRAVWGQTFVEEELSMYYLTLEVAQVSTGMMIAVGDKPWTVFRTISRREFMATMRRLAKRMDLRKYTKHKRGPKKKQPKKISGKRNHHVSTARILALRA
jgi:Transposase DDE domain